MNQNHLPVLKFPTTAMLLDNDQLLLNNLALYFENKIPVITFTKPKEALSYLQKQESLEDKIKNCCFKKVGEIESDIDEEAELVQYDYLVLLSVLYDPQRFTTISALLVDYDMPK